VRGLRGWPDHQPFIWNRVMEISSRGDLAALERLDLATPDNSSLLAPECEQARSYIVGLRSTGSVVRWNGRSGVVLQRRKWDRLTPDDQSKLIWSVAKATTCSDGQMIHLVRITDTGEKILRVQKVSLDPQCHGDTVNEAVWYRC